MKIGIDMGHSLSGAGSSACGIVKESDINRLVGKLVIEKLQNLGHTVVNCTVDYASTSNAQLQGIVKKANAQPLDLFVSIHLNAGGAHGTETYTIPGAASSTTAIAKRLNDKVVASCNFINRGIKTANYYVLKYTSMPAVLLELFFCDSSIDCGKYDNEKIAVAIVEGILNTTISSGSTTDDEVIEKPSVDTNIIGTEVPGYNAMIINDFFYTRDCNGTKDGGKINIGDKIKVLDISYSKQLTYVEYSSNNSIKKAYITNAANCIAYIYQDQWKNGSTSEIVYGNSKRTMTIGSLSPHETATPLYRENNILHVVYSTSKGNNTKSGYVAYNGGFNKL